MIHTILRIAAVLLTAALVGLSIQYILKRTEPPASRGTISGRGHNNQGDTPCLLSSRLVCWPHGGSGATSPAG